LSSQSLDDFANRKLEALERRQLRRELRVTEPTDAVHVRRNGSALVSFASNDYLGLATDPATIAASIEATQRFGVGAGASRLITGNHPLYAALERQLAALKGTEDAVVFGSGYLTNIGVMPLLAGASDLLLVDELAHSCILTGAELCRAATHRFAHNDLAALTALLDRHRARHRHCLIVTDGVFSMEGDLAPLPALAALAERHDAWLMSDDAHGLGVVGGGRGSSFAHGEPVDLPLQMGTLSKAIGAYGGYLCTSRPVADLIRTRARSFVYSTGLPPGTVAAAVTALQIIAAGGERLARPLALARRFTDALGLPRAESAIVPLLLGSAERALAASEALERSGLLVPAIRPPTVPAGSARLRIAFSSAHADADIDRLIAAVRRLNDDR
jgi:8-amino-7-oxononanoate synthase